MANAHFSSMVQSQTTALDLGQELVNAARRGDIQRVRELLDSGAEPDSQDLAGATALHWAAWACNHRLVHILVDAGATLDAPNRVGETALMLAVSGPWWDKNSGYLTQVSQLDGQATVALLLSKGPNIRLKDAHGETALSRARRDRPPAHSDPTRPLRAEDQKRRERADKIIELLENAEKAPKDIIY